MLRKVSIVYAFYLDVSPCMDCGRPKNRRSDSAKRCLDCAHEATLAKRRERLSKRYRDRKALTMLSEINSALRALYSARLLVSTEREYMTIESALEGVDCAAEIKDAGDLLRSIAADMRETYTAAAIEHLEDGGEREADSGRYIYHVSNRIHWTISDAPRFAHWCQRRRISMHRIAEVMTSKVDLAQLCVDLMRTDNVIPDGVQRFNEPRIVRRKRDKQ